MQTSTRRSRFQPAAVSSLSKRTRRPGAPARREGGFTLIEVMICTVILTTGMLAIAGLLGITTHMHIGAREAARSTRLAEEKIDELMKENFTTSASVAVGGSLDTNTANYCEARDTAPCTAIDVDDVANVDGVTIRWAVADGPVDDTRVLTVHVENLRARQYGRNVELSTIIRQW